MIDLDKCVHVLFGLRDFSDLEVGITSWLSSSKVIDRSVRDKALSANSNLFTIFVTLRLEGVHSTLNTVFRDAEMGT